MGLPTKLRNCKFTTNNYTPELYDQIKNFLENNTTYFIIGKEIGESGTPHLQGYAEFKSSRNFTALQKKIPNSWLAPRNMTQKEGKWIEIKQSSERASEYCKKDGDFIEGGQLSEQGSRSDIQLVRDILQDNSSNPMRQVTQVATSYQSIKVAEQYLKYNEVKRNTKPEVFWYFGSTGTGKTYKAFEQLEDPYVWNTPKWWDGYDAHTELIIDDFRKDFCTFHTLLRILDRYSHQVETKGGMRSLLATKIIITCPYHPREVYNTREDIEQLIRRIDYIQEFEPRENMA